MLMTCINNVIKPAKVLLLCDFGDVPPQPFAITLGFEIMFSAMHEFSKKTALLTQVFADESDPRVGYFCRQFTLPQLNALVSLRNMVLERGEIERYSLGNYQLTLSDKTSKAGCMRGQHLPPKDVNAFDVLFDLVVNGQYSVDQRALWRRGPLQRQNISRLAGSTIPLVIVVATLAVYTQLVNLAIEADRASYARRQSYIDQELCIYKKDICIDDEDGSTYDCVKLVPMQKGINCGSSSFFIYLTMIAVVILGISSNIYTNRHDKKLFQSMRATCDDPKYDVLLNDILFRDDSTIGWSKKIKVKGATCTLRKLTLILLLCFDDRMYTEFLPDFTRRLQTGERDISLEHDGAIILLQRMALGTERHHGPSAFRY